MTCQPSPYDVPSQAVALIPNSCDHAAMYRPQHVAPSSLLIGLSLLFGCSSTHKDTAITILSPPPKPTNTTSAVPPPPPPPDNK